MSQIRPGKRFEKISCETQKHWSHAQMISAFLFLVCGLPGLLIMMVSSYLLFVRFYDPSASDVHIHPLVLTLCAVIGAVLMLMGVGLWRQWAYLLVFAAIPVSLSIFIMIDARGPGISTGLAAFVVMFSFGSLYLVRAFYRRQNKRRSDDSSSDAHARN